jgi:DNA-binding MarR family transcriptional regulator
MKIQSFLGQSPLVAVIQAARVLDNELNRLLKDKGLNFSTALVLVSVLFEEPRTVTPSHLAAALSMTKGNVSHSIASLEAAGLLARRLNPEDARAHHLTLKPQGKKVAMQVVRVLHQMQTSFEKTIGSAQIKGLINLLRQIEQECANIAAR